MKRRLIILASFGLILILGAACSSPQVDTAPVQEVPISQPESTKEEQAPATEAASPIPDTPSISTVDSPQLTSIRFINELNGWGMSTNGVLRTEDGGTTWLNVSPAGVTDFGYGAVGYFFDAAHGWLAVSNPMDPAQEGLLYRTSDGGLNWAESTLPPSMGGRFSFIDPANGFFMADLGAGAGSNWVGIYSTTDGGVTWEPRYVPEPGSPEGNGALPGGGQKSGMTFLDTDRGWVTGNIPMDNYLYLYNTSDGGSTWAEQPGPVPTDFGTVFTSTYPPVFFGNEGVMPVTLVGSVVNLLVYTSSDAGTTWTPAPAPVANAGRGELVDFVSPAEGFAWANGRFAVTHDAALSWDTITPSVPFGDNLLMMDFVDTATGWVLTMDSSSHASLFKTSDGGTNWTTLIP